MSKKQFSNQLSFLLLHLDGCDSLTFIQASLYIQNNSDFPFFQFFPFPVHHLISPVSAHTSFNALTQCGGLCLVTFFFFASNFKAAKAHLLSNHDSRRL